DCGAHTGQNAPDRAGLPWNCGSPISHNASYVKNSPFERARARCHSTGPSGRRATAHPKQHCTHFATRLSRPTPQLSFESTVEVRSNVAANVVARPCAHSPTPRWLTPAGLGDRHLLHSNRTVFEARSPPVGGSRADGLRAAPLRLDAVQRRCN